MSQNPQQNRLSSTSMTMASNGRNFVLAAAHLQAHAFKTMMRYQMDTLTLLRNRCEQDIKLLDDIFDSTEWNEALDGFTRLVKDTAGEPADDAGKLAAIGSDYVADTAKRGRKQADGENGASQSAA